MINKMSCFLIGDESHLIRCAEILLAHGHKIHGIISSRAEIQSWTKKQGITSIKPGTSLMPVLSKQPFDYFFSIINNHIIPLEILELPKKGAINFHDGPLPKYAGLNVTSWAIINQEKSHGITWHFMSSGIDKGDIIKQRFLKIDENESTFTLNAKCYEASILAFAEMIDELETCRVDFQQQNLAERTYFSMCKRPPAAGTISWQKPADQISALVRGLNFGPKTMYTNPIGLPKLLVGNRVFTVSEIEILDTGSQVKAGCIVALENNSLRVATESKEVLLNKILTMNGRELSIDDFTSMTGVCKGDKLDELTPETESRLTEVNSEICKHERFWVNKLSEAKFIDLPFTHNKKATCKPTQITVIPIHIPHEINGFKVAEANPDNQHHFLVAVFAAFLARATCTSKFNLWFSNGELNNDITGFEQFFSSYVPLQIKVDFAAEFSSFLEDFIVELSHLREHKTFTSDLPLRYPQLTHLGTYEAPSLQNADLMDSVDNYTKLSASGLTALFSEDGRECTWIYDTSLWDNNYIECLQKQFDIFLHNLIKLIHLPLSEITLLSEEEYKQVLVSWNNTNVDYPLNLLMHQVFEAQAEKTPHATAVIFEDKQLTYSELNRQANQLAHYLQSVGVGPEVLVGICVERSLEMIIGLYGILKAGGAYVPIDPEYPDSRIEYMLANTQVKVLLTQSKFLTKLPEVNAQVVCLDTEWKNTMANQRMDTPLCKTTLEQLAYVIYTSGSTGKPKGVMNTHHGILNRLLWMQDAYSLTSSDHVLQKTPFSFDVSVWEFFWPMMFGACLVVARPEGHKDSAYLVQIIKEHQISTLHFVPSMLQLFLTAKNVEQCRSLRQVICSGEALPLDLQNRFFDRLHAKLHNLYGPTEAAVDVTFWECNRNNNLKMVPIGRPIANTQTYILDSQMQPVPVGTQGELHIGGVQVARGYINRPELTAEKFIPDPFVDAPGARLYKTGDLARYLPDGNIEYLGRNDHQVKVRGFRVELGEIETCLTNNPQVREAVVAVREDVVGSMELIGYVVPSHGELLAVESLRKYLKNVLPDYMVPGRYVMLESLPLTPNGKVDRKALPQPTQIRPETEKDFVAPVNNFEKELSKIWCQLLRLDQVGMHDNFFDIGGNSLLSLQVVALVNNALDIDISVTKLFQYPTIRSFVKGIEQTSESQPDYSLTETRAKTRREAMLKRKKQKIKNKS